LSLPYDSENGPARSPLSFFHLALARGVGETIDLAIADRSGETCADAAMRPI